VVASLTKPLDFEALLDCVARCLPGH